MIALIDSTSALQVTQRQSKRFEVKNFSAKDEMLQPTDYTYLNATAYSTDSPMVIIARRGLTPLPPSTVIRLLLSFLHDDVWL